MRVVKIILLATLAYAVAQPGQTGAAQNYFESYVLALEWQPSWSLDACPSGANPNAALINFMNSSASTYSRTHLSLHGLWPNYNPILHKGFEWPQFCNGRGFNFSDCVKNMMDEHCQPNADALGRYNGTMSSGWQTWAPEYAYGDLAAHEWAKHGSCTIYNPQSTYLQHVYWGWQKDAMVNISMGQGATLVTVNVGKSVSLDKLQAAFDADAGGHRTTLVCQPTHPTAGCKLDQVWLGFEAEMPYNPGYPLTPLVMPSHGVNTISASTCDAYCGTTGVYIPEWKGCPVRK